MSDGRLLADTGAYRQATTMNTAPPQIGSDALVTGPSPVEQLLRILGLAANLSDQQDDTLSLEQHAERDTTTRQAAERFAAQDEYAAAELNGILGEPNTAAEDIAAQPDRVAATLQQLPQLASGIAGALAGAVGGALQPLAQLPQQTAQGVQQALQTGMGLFGTAGAEPIVDAPLDEVPLAEDFDLGADDLGYGGGAGGGDIGAGGLETVAGGGPGPVNGTAPMAYLGPPPVPPASTAPSSAPAVAVTPAVATPAAGPGTAGMAGVPMVPPGAMGATAGAEKDGKADTKRVSVPSVRNGAPVQGRLTLPPPPPLVKKSVGTPVVTRRIAASGDSRSADTESDS